MHSHIALSLIAISTLVIFVGCQNNLPEKPNTPTPEQQQATASYYIAPQAIFAGILQKEAAKYLHNNDNPTIDGLGALLAKRLLVEEKKEEKVSPDLYLKIQVYFQTLGEIGMKQTALTLHGRRDLAQHFLVGMGLGASIPQILAEEACHVKEINDSAPGGSGYDYTDLAAGLFGVRAGMSLIIINGEKFCARQLNRIANGKLRLSSLSPKLDLPHLPAGKKPDMKIDREARLRIDEAWRKTIFYKPQIR